MKTTEEIELSVVIPCLNEADTLGVCISKAWAAIRSSGIAAEIIVADNGSDDGSVDIAISQGARVVPIPLRGYGHALMGGIAVARGRFVIMGDADDSYDFSEVSRFVGKLREGFDLVQGCRLADGGGRVLPGAMPFLHRWLGNPVLTWLARLMFRVPIHDIYCGMRGFTKECYGRLHLHCAGMEFATEMIIKATLYGEKITEIPITLHPDGRRSHPPHLKTFRDGWRTLRIFLLFSPRWLYLIPGILLGLFGFTGYALAMPGIKIGHVAFDAHTLIFSSLALLLGHLSVLFAVFTRIFAAREGIAPANQFVEKWFVGASLERGLILGFISLGMGVVLLFKALWAWHTVDFGNLDYAHTMRIVVPGFALVALGYQTVLGSFFISILNMNRKD